MAEDPRALLAEGRLVPPLDDITARGLEVWKDSPPLYHDLSCVPYTKFDVQEWIGRVKKYKAEAVRYADRCRKLEREVNGLQTELERDTGQLEGLEESIAAAVEHANQLQQVLQEEMARRNVNSAEVVALRRNKQDIIKHEEDLHREISETKMRIGILKTEVDRNRKRHEAALGEKEKLNLERRWFFHERLLLEETTLREIQDIAVMKEKLEKLRHCMHRAWRDVKALDLLGHIRATKRSPINEEWYAARRRAFVRKRPEAQPAEGEE